MIYIYELKQISEGATFIMSFIKLHCHFNLEK